MKVLVLGSGGREHALAWKIAQSPLVSVVFLAPGNAGTALEPVMKNVNISATDIPALLNFARESKIDLTIVGPETPLALGLVDVFREAQLKVFGPTKAAAQLESSKIFTKRFLTRHSIPTAEYQHFTEVESAIRYLCSKNAPIVIKANGLASGKGVIVATTIEEAKILVREIITGNMFGDAGRCILIEEFLVGEEVSFTVMVDGEYILPMATSQDYKRVGDGDTGKNTGGMGAYSPVPFVTNKVFHRIMKRIIIPTIKGMSLEGNTYTGFLYAGLIVDKEENPKVIEFNCRFGDPEAQSVMLRMKSDLIDLCLASCEKKLSEKLSIWDDRVSLSVVIAARGYPESYHIGDEIHGLSKDKNKISNSTVKIFHSGTKLSADGRILSNGGRVLCVTALGKNIKEAQKNAYEIVSNIYFNGNFSRKDIGYRAILYEKSNKKIREAIMFKSFC